MQRILQFVWTLMAATPVHVTLDILEMESYVMVGQIFVHRKTVQFMQYARNVLGTDNVHILQILMSALEQMSVILMQTV